MSEFDEELYYEKISKMLYDLVKNKHMKDNEIQMFTNKVIEKSYEIAISKKDSVSASKFNAIYRRLNQGNNIKDNNEILEMLNENKIEIDNSIKKSA